MTVSRLSVTPVKGLGLHHPTTIDLTPEGVPGDRVFFLLDGAGKLESCTRNQALFGLTADYDEASGRLAVSRDGEVLREGATEPAEAVRTNMWGLRTITSDVVADPGWSELFSDLLGKKVRLMRAREPGYDVEPVTLLGTESVAELERRSGTGPIDSRRFRMLIEFSGGAPHVEDSWDGRLLTVGEVTLRAGGPVQRCAATARHPETGRVDLQTLRYITAYRGRQESIFGPGANFGVYAEVVVPGPVSVGDAVEPSPTVDT